MAKSAGKGKCGRDARTNYYFCTLVWVELVWVELVIFIYVGSPRQLWAGIKRSPA